jgi:para-nitrobenzyl esterase
MGEPSVGIAAGVVRGRAVAEGAVAAFLGIPYARAARFRPPERVTAFARGAIDAVAYGPSCPQRYMDPGDVTPEREALSAQFGIPLLEAQPEAEDGCLVLNVWTPAADGAARPVLVRFHGRGFHGGSGSWAWADGARLAARGDAVVVTVNHRLAVLGHAMFDGWAGSGNAGVLDLVAALEWVRDSIAAFGGDPGNVTIFGESGGGAKVATLLHVPAARGLFHRAIVQSGGGFTPLPAARGLELGAALLDALGAGSPEEAAGLPVERVLEAQLAVAATAGPGGSGAAARTQRVPPFRPVLDGVVVTDGPPHDVPLLIGTSRHEMTMFLAVEGLGRPGGFSVDAAGLAERLAPVLGDRAGDVIAGYRAAEPDLSATDVLVLVLSDLTFRFPGMDVAAAHRAPVFAYLLAWESPALGGFLRATHGLCVPLSMDTTAAVPMADSPAGRAMAELMSEAWLAFARTGSPQTPALPAWPRFDPERRATMLLDLEPRVAEDPHGAQRRALAAATA